MMLFDVSPTLLHPSSLVFAVTTIEKTWRTFVSKGLLLHSFPTSLYLPRLLCVTRSLLQKKPSTECVSW